MTNLTGYLKFLPPIKKGKEKELKLKVNEEFNRDSIVSRLEEYGYTRDSLVTATGTYAVRGFILDIFSTFLEHPVRIEFFGDFIESIRYFDEDTQLSLNSIEEILISPYDEITLDGHNSLVDYLENPIVLYYDYSQINVGYQKLLDDIVEYKESNEISTNMEYMYKREDFVLTKEVYIETLNNLNTSEMPIFSYRSLEIENFRSNFELLKEKVFAWLRDKKTVVFCLSKEHQVKQIKELFENVSIFKKEELVKNHINIVVKRVNHGFILDDFVIISEYDIEQVNSADIKYKNTLKIGKKVNSLNNLELGDYVVHRSHGIGIYNGVVTLTQMGMQKDFIQINYLGNDKVYIQIGRASCRERV